MAPVDAVVSEAVAVDARVGDVYAMWRNPLSLAAFVDSRIRVEELDDRRSRWSIPGPDGQVPVCTAAIVGEFPELVIAWAVEDGPLPHEGRVRFDHLHSGTRIAVDVRCGLPATDVDPSLPRRLVRQTLDRVQVATRGARST